MSWGERRFRFSHFFTFFLTHSLPPLLDPALQPWPRLARWSVARPGRIPYRVPCWGSVSRPAWPERTRSSLGRPALLEVGSGYPEELARGRHLPPAGIPARSFDGFLRVAGALRA